MVTLSICIPTFNRPDCLLNCLNSIYIAKKKSNISLEVCVSDNNSNYNTKEIVEKFNDNLLIKFNKNEKNLGLGVNILKSVSMAKGQFVWIIGNDDLLLPKTLFVIENLLNKNKLVDFYYINSFHLDTNYIKNFTQPFDTKNLEDLKMKKFSNYNFSKELDFFDLVNPTYSFDFMLGMFLCIFRRSKWVQNLDVIDSNLISDLNTYSSFDNTCPHIKIWAKSFNNSKAYFQADPLSVNLYGEREWGSLYPFVEAVRIPEVVDEYRKNGLPFLRYIYCKNYALRKFIPSIFKMIINYNSSGIKFISIKKNVVKNILYPSIYYGALYILMRKIFKILTRVK
jgi:glycosyltransferase involved in cell wall biosynthesis